MLHPEYLYYLALVFIALPSVPFNRLAAVVIIVWAFEAFGVALGVPQGQVDLIGDTGGLVFGMAYCLTAYRPAYWLAALMFLPMMAVDVATMKGMVDPTSLYWLSYGLAMVQILSLPGGNDWHRVAKTWTCYRKSKSVDWFARLLARRHAL